MDGELTALSPESEGKNHKGVFRKAVMAKKVPYYREPVTVCGSDGRPITNFNLIPEEEQKQRLRNRRQFKAEIREEGGVEVQASRVVFAKSGKPIHY